MSINLWNQTRKEYLGWLNKTKLRVIFSNDISYKGLSLWWLTKLMDKDNWNFPEWYTDLHNLLTLKKKIKKKRDFCLLNYVFFF